MENKQLQILVTGAGGFVGQRFITVNSSRYKILQASLRDPSKLDSLDLRNVDVIVHLAGKAHEMKPIPDNIYFDVNYELTKALAEKAIASNVPHFIYVSSTKVYGDVVTAELSEFSTCSPTDAYGKSKLMAEEWLRERDSETFRVAVVRPPLIYGPFVKGNMNKLLNLCASGWPLPFAGIENRRSMVSIDNFIALLDAIISQQARGIFIAGDAQPVSTAWLVSTIRKHMHKKPGIFTVPRPLLGLLKRFRPALYERLFGSFVVNNASTNEKLNFAPPFSSEEGIEVMTQWFKNNNKTK